MAKRDLPSPQALRQLLHYNPDTGELLWCERPREMFRDVRSWNTWNARFAGKPAITAGHGNGYKSGAVFNRRVFAHRVIWAIMSGRWPDDQIDHVNGVRSDNRWSNLREATATINGKNIRKNGRNTSGHNGVFWCKREKKWGARIVADRKIISLGNFDKIADAVAAREAANRLYGFTKRHGT